MAPSSLTFTPVSAIAGVNASLRAAFASGVTRPLAWRKKQIRAILRLVRESEALICDALRMDLKRPAFEGVIAEVATVVAEAEMALASIDAWTAREAVSTPIALLPGSSYVYKEPLGVVCIIGPWNFPIQLCLIPLISALAAGNAAVLKPSEVSPACSALLEVLVSRYLDTDAVRIVQGGVTETTALLAERWDSIFYTGNSAVGKIVMTAAAKHLTPCTLELGGKSPAIVAADADLDRAAAAIMAGKCLNAGQVCIAPDYVLVERSVEAALIERLAAATDGRDTKASPHYGRIVNKRHWDRVMSLLKGSGGKVVVGGESDSSDLFIAPTVLTGPFNDGASIMKEEIFGPLLPVIAVDSLDAAVQHVNAGEKPLALYVFSTSSATQRRLLAEVPAGGATVNDTISHIANPSLPFGGVGNSGMGANHGVVGFKAFSHSKAVFFAAPKLLDFGWLRFPPFTQGKLSVVKLFFNMGTLRHVPSVKDVLIVGLSAAVIVLSLRVAGKI